MKFSISAALVSLAAVSSVAASPMPVAEVSVANQEVPSDDAAYAPQDDFEQPETADTRGLALTTYSEALFTGLSKRATNFHFKIHVVNAAARVLGIIIIDYTINLLPGSHESTTANFDKLTNVRTNGPFVAAYFDRSANPLAAAQNAVFDFTTSMGSGTLHVFNENNAKIESINI
ncbi:unnamed protein product [Colletotrichum noveboracense]|uniref:Uncharacterized protein n=1 Tax=Colletotrichum noveboracense TaxID=2664923 RepID=A0A9W4WFZ9_9PEZI|nr:unnamed protein product [Colletotrichum noveboracense]